MKVIVAFSVLLALLPSVTIAMIIKDAGGILFTKDEVAALTTRIKDQDNAVADLVKEVSRLKEKIERFKNDSCV